MGPTKSQNQDFSTIAPLDNRKSLFKTMPLLSDNYKFFPTFSTVSLIKIFPLPRARASLYPGQPSGFGMLHATHLKQNFALEIS